MKLTEAQRKALSIVASNEGTEHHMSMIAGKPVDVTKRGCSLAYLHKSAAEALERKGLVVFDQFHEDTPNYILVRLTPAGVDVRKEG